LLGTIPLRVVILTKEKKTNKQCLLSLGLVLFCLTSFLEAHDIVLLPVLSGKSVRLTMKFGEPGSYLLTTREKVVALDIYDPTGTMKSWAKNIAADGNFLVATPPEGSASTPGSWMFAASYDNGYSIVMPDGKRRPPAPGEKGIHVLRYGKALLAVGKPGGDIGRVVGHRLELIPKTDPLALRPGQTLQVVVRWEGKPLSGAELFVHDAVTTPFKIEELPKYKTDAQGVARVPISRSGLHVVVLDHSAAPSRPDLATEDALSATLSFVVRKQEGTS
jgi:uncharacterized GH25 family protein